MTARHWPRWSELQPLLRPRRARLNPTERLSQQLDWQRRLGCADL